MLWKGKKLILTNLKVATLPVKLHVKALISLVFVAFLWLKHGTLVQSSFGVSIF